MALVAGVLALEAVDFREVLDLPAAELLDDLLLEVEAGVEAADRQKVLLELRLELSAAAQFRVLEFEVQFAVLRVEA